jgi:hypothetical protein
VKFAFGSFDNSFARRLGQQAANAVAHGLPYEEAKGRTLYPAQILGLDANWGPSKWKSGEPDCDYRDR